MLYIVYRIGKNPHNQPNDEKKIIGYCCAESSQDAAELAFSVVTFYPNQNVVACEFESETKEAQTQALANGDLRDHLMVLESYGFS